MTSAVLLKVKLFLVISRNTAFTSVLLSPSVDRPFSSKKATALRYSLASAAKAMPAEPITAISARHAAAAAHLKRRGRFAAGDRSPVVSRPSAAKTAASSMYFRSI